MSEIYEGTDLVEVQIQTGETVVVDPAVFDIFRRYQPLRMMELEGED